MDHGGRGKREREEPGTRSQPYESSECRLGMRSDAILCAIVPRIRTYFFELFLAPCCHFSPSAISRSASAAALFFAALSALRALPAAFLLLSWLFLPAIMTFVSPVCAVLVPIEAQAGREGVSQLLASGVIVDSSMDRCAPGCSLFAVQSTSRRLPRRHLCGLDQTSLRRRRSRPGAFFLLFSFLFSSWYRACPVCLDARPRIRLDACPGSLTLRILL